MGTRPAKPSASSPNVPSGALRPRERLWLRGSGSAGRTVQGGLDPGVGEGGGGWQRSLHKTPVTSLIP